MNYDFSEILNKIMCFLGIVTVWFFCFWFVQLLWNWVAVSLFGLPVITYWEAFGLSFLVKLLVKSMTIEFNKNA